MTTRFLGCEDDVIDDLRADENVHHESRNGQNEATPSIPLSSLQSIEVTYSSSESFHGNFATNNSIPQSENTKESSFQTTTSMVTPPPRNRPHGNLSATDETSYISDLDNNLASDSSRPKSIPHVYHDYNRVCDTGTNLRKKTGGVTQPFPEKLHVMLSSVDHNEKERDIVSWLPHGRSFIVRNPTQFTLDIMPK
jgi:HSF-type DNA-binding